MKVTRRVVTTLLTASIALWAAAVHAGISPKTSASLYGGFAYPHSDYVSGGKLALGAGLFVSATKRLEVGVLGGYDRLGEESGENFHVSYLDLAARFPLTRGSVEIYPVLGLGSYRMRQHSEVFVTKAGTDGKFGILAGAGMRIGPKNGTGRTRFGLELRWHELEKSDESDDGLTLVRRSTRFWNALLGMTVLFGK